MKYGVVIPYSEARAVAEQAYAAEQAGWDGIFVGEAIWHHDAWVGLTAAAMRTERIRLGTMLSPMPLTTPWKLAAESATLDRLSGGRVILALGVGAVWMGWGAFPGYPQDIRARAARLDEGIDIITQLHAGQPFDYVGQHYQVRLTTLDPQHYPPPPIQRPRVPIWVVGVWPRARSMRRALRCDGLIPAVMRDDGQFVDLRPEDLAAVRASVDASREPAGPFDLVVEGQVGGLDAGEARDRLAAWEAAGATWWLETLWGVDPGQAAARISAGPAAR